MERYEILATAARSYNPKLKNIKPTVFSVLDNLLQNIKYGNEVEEDRRKELFEKLEALQSTQVQTIGGCKTADVQSLIDTLFTCQNDRFVNKDLEKMNCHEVHLYFAYISRLVQSKYDLPGEMQKDARRAAEERRAIALHEERARQEQEEESARELEQRRSHMTAVDRDIFDIEHGVDDTAINKILERLKDYEAEDRIAVAKAVKAWFIVNGKWEGKQSKKQTGKISYIKSLLEKV